jgi:class 3 adenylate cyclase
MQEHKMEAIEKRVVIVLADISGYTQFMVENQMSAVHGQQFITFLIETMIREIDIPLRLQEIEGDALFLYAEDPGSEKEWRDVLEQVPAMLSRFFNAFYEGIVLGMEATPCKCAICRNGKDLALKIVVHSGSAVFNQVGGFNKVSGPDVILAHRLLKNSVPDKEYLLMSEAAYSSIGHKIDGPLLRGKETYEGFGSINTVVRFNGDIKEQLVMRAQSYSIGAIAGLFPALVRHLRSPIVGSGWFSRLRFAVMLVLLAPIMTMMYMISAPRRLLAQRAGQDHMLIEKAEST